MAHETLPTEFTQPFGVLHHLRCLDPLMYVVTEDPEAIAEGVRQLLKKYLDTTYISNSEGLCAMASQRALQRGDESPERQPILSSDEPAKTLVEVQRRACRDEVYTLVVLNPEAWLARESVMADLLEWAKVRDERQAMMVMFAGPADLKVPEAIKPYMPRIEAGFSLDKPHPLPRDAGTSLEDVTKTVEVILGKLRMDQAVAPAIAERMVGFTEPLIDIALAQCIIYGKRVLEDRDAVLLEPGKVLDKVFDGWERINGWPV
jgi:hypothetical protein